MKTRKILSAIGTFVIVGAVSTAGAALWTNVLDGKFQMVKTKLTHPKSDKIIFVDFKRAKRDLGLKQRLSPFRTNGTAYYGDKTLEEVTSMNKEKWTEKPITWGGYLKFCGVFTVISTIISAVYCIALFEPAWWIGIRKTVAKLFNGRARRRSRF